MEPIDSNGQLGVKPADHPPDIPDHQLLRCIGRGSYGIVWLARSRLGVYRAVKVVYRKSFDNPKPFDREWSGIQKFEPISRSHEGFVDILQVGINREEGYFYYVMELGDDTRLGQKIDPDQYQAKTLLGEVIARHKLPYDECLRMGLALSLALAEVHKRGLVHRDVKPSNIIYVNDVPKLADIGLVTEAGGAQSYVGTEGFIPPEGPGTPQADVYGLGKVLYEASTGRDRLDFPELPTRLGQMVENDPFMELNEVLLRACNRNIKARYQTAWEMYLQLLVLADGKSVKRLNDLEKLLKKIRRAGIAMALVIAVVAGIGFHFYREAQFRSGMQQRAVEEDVEHGNQALESGNPLAALPEYVKAFSLDQGVPGHELLHRLRLGSVLAQIPRLTHFWLETNAVKDGSFDSEGKRVIIAQDRGKASVYDLATRKLIGQSFAHYPWLTSAAISPDGQFAVTVSQGANSGAIWDLARNEIDRHLQHPGGVYSVRYSHDGKHVVTCGLENTAIVWNSLTGDKELTLEGHTAMVVSAEFSLDDRMIVTASRDRTVRIWNASNGHALFHPLTHANWVNHASFSPDGTMVVTADADMLARVWRVTGEQFPTLIKHRKMVMSAEFSPDGRLILTASLDGTVSLWDADTLQPAAENPVLKLGVPVRHACFNAGGDCILAVCQDGSARIWSLAGSLMPQVELGGNFCRDGSRCFVISNQSVDVRESLSGRLISQIRPAGTSPTVLNSSPDGRFVLIMTPAEIDLVRTNFTLTVWDSTSGSELTSGIQFSNRIDGAALSSDGKTLLLISGNAARTWDANSGRALSDPMVHEGKVVSADFGPDNQHVVSVSGSDVYVWGVSNGSLLFPPLHHPCDVTHAEFSPDGSRLVSACADPGLTKRFAQVWDARSGAPEVKVTLNDGVLYASFSPDGKRIGTGDEDFAAAVWDTYSGRRLTPLLQHAEKVKMLSFSPDGKWIVTVCVDGTARIWNSQTGAPLTPRFPSMGRITKARFLPDGRSIITGGDEGRCWIWRLPVNQYPLEDVIRTARLLSNGQYAPQNGVEAPDSLITLWQDLSSRYPADFVVSPGEIEAWHVLEASRNHRNRHWSAEAFHLRALLARRPDDTEMIGRLNEARKHLAVPQSGDK